MEIKLIIKKVFIILLFFFYTYATAQVKRSDNYCFTQTGKSIDFSVKRTDSLYCDYVIEGNLLKINIVNPSKDTLYLFKSYFAQELYPSKYIHQIDRKNKVYYISFAPIVSSLTTNKTDKVILGENSVGHKGQVLYDFIKLNPGTFYQLEIDRTRLFKNHLISNNAVRYFDHFKLSKFKNANFKALTTSNLKGRYDVVVQFGIYDDVRLLCDKSKYYMNEIEFDRKSKVFKMINLNVRDIDPNSSPID